MSEAESRSGPNSPAESPGGRLPLVQELIPPPDPEAVFCRFVSRQRCVFFDSARRHPTLGRYSFLACDPFAWLEMPVGSPDPFAALARVLSQCDAPWLAGLPPFQGGAAGLFSYDLGRSLERLPSPRWDEFGLPAMAVGLYDVVVAFDHQLQRAWLISQGWPEAESAQRRRRAEERRDEVLALLEERAPPLPTSEHSSGEREPLPLERLAPEHRFAEHAHLWSNFSPTAYQAAVARVIEYIRAGDVFQVNLAQRLLHPAVDHPASLYLRLRRRNPATFAGYFDLGPFQIASASPERFVRVEDRRVETRPIKGTRQRVQRPEADLFAADELLASDKDRAENVMIVDLLRNDLARVCLPASVRVSQLCRLESYEYVQHLVSAVEGVLRPGATGLDLLQAAFPGGSITGAPKIRAMEIIAGLEPTARGAYCGSLGYFGPGGRMDTSILIRTITAGRGWWQAPVGGGVVVQSEPRSEYLETWHKAEGLLRAMAE